MSPVCHQCGQRPGQADENGLVLCPECAADNEAKAPVLGGHEIVDDRVRDLMRQQEPYDGGEQ